MHMDTYPYLIPLVILIPAIGAFINYFWGHRVTERISGLIGITAALLTFFISLLIFSYLNGSHGAAQVINPVFFDGWIRIESIGLDIPWQFRVDTITSVMLLVVTGVGSAIHIYSMGYMHGDPRFGLFFGYLNMFLMFMLILVSANNFLMLFVGWEGVGLCSFLLIGFWWDKAKGVGWRNSNAAIKAMVANRVGDFGILMAMFLIFWTFGTLNFYSPGEIANVPFTLEVNGYEVADLHGEGDEEHGEEGGEDGAAVTDEDHSEDTEDTTETTEEGDHSEDAESVADADTEDDHGDDTAAGGAAGDEGDHGEDAGDHGEDDGHGAALSREQLDNSLFEPHQLGVFGQIEYRMNLPEDDPGRMVNLGPYELDIQTVIFLIILFMLLGVSGKSAQFPLLVWLPDAMAGPTPVSALMHAATMVTAGVFLLVRSNVMLDASPEGRLVVALIGTFTALFGGVAALGQWDIKRVLAFSTISQLGFMVAAAGIGAYVAALFHLATHAVFKALLFLGSGSIIHGVEHGHHHVHEHSDHHDDDHHDDDFDPQDMRNMGGLRKRMPVTYWTYLFGTLALAGIIPFAGFWSKDEILVDAWEVGFAEGQIAGYIVLGGLLLAAGFTAFYMWRQIQMVFFGDPRSEAAAHAPESSPWMTVPLVILAFGALVAGFVNVPPQSPAPWFKTYELKHFLESSIPSITTGHTIYFNFILALTATVVAVGAIVLAHTIYAGNKAVRGEEKDQDPLQQIPEIVPVFEAANRRLYLDDIYHTLILRPYEVIARFLANVIDWALLHDYFHDRVLKAGYDTVAKFLGQGFDLGVIDAIVNGVGWVTQRISLLIRPIQTGYVRTYAVAVLLGVVVVLVIMLLPLLQNGS